MKEIIGHYYKKAKGCDSNTVLEEVRRDTFKQLIDSLNPNLVCPYSKTTDSSRYKNWKSNNIPILFFTMLPHRPDKDTPAGSTCYAMIDIDDNSAKYVSEHPAICFTNYTKSGTHLFIHSYAFSKAQTPMEWQDIYNSIAYEVWYDLCCKYSKDIKLDGSNAKHTQGCYLWNTEWVKNNNLDMSWMPSERYLDDNIINEMYSNDTYKRQPNTTTVLTNSGRARNIDKQNTADVISNICAINHRHKFSKQVEKDFKTLSYNEFIEKYSDTYNITTGTEPVFTPYIDYQGNIYDMYKTDGKMVKLWQPYMKKGDDFKIKEGGRHTSLLSSMYKLCQLTHENLDPDHILYNAVHWIARYCENPSTFHKDEIISIVTSAMNKHDQTDECSFYFDKRMFVTGDTMIKQDTGKAVSMNKGMKISANAKCRKTERIIKVLNLWKPNLSIEENLSNIKSWEDKDTMKLTKKTALDYIKNAKNIPELAEKHPWIETYTATSKNKGRQKQQITIQNIVTEEIMTFESKKECCEYLKISKMTLSKFIKGLSKLNKTYKILKI